MILQQTIQPKALETSYMVINSQNKLPDKLQKDYGWIKRLAIMNYQNSSFRNHKKRIQRDLP